MNRRESGRGHMHDKGHKANPYARFGSATMLVVLNYRNAYCSYNYGRPFPNWNRQSPGHFAGGGVLGFVASSTATTKSCPRLTSWRALVVGCKLRVRATYAVRHARRISRAAAKRNAMSQSSRTLTRILLARVQAIDQTSARNRAMVALPCTTNS